jgi:membrane protein
MAHTEPMDGRQASARQAKKPWRLGFRGWTQTLRRVREEVDKDNLSLVAGGAAFFGFLSIFPALAAVFAIYGLAMDPAEVEAQLAGLTSVLPQSAAELIQEQLERLASADSGTLGLSAIVAIVVALWSANKGTKGLVQAMNIAYDEREERGFFKLNAITLGFTVAAVLTVGVILALVAGIPALLGRVGLGEAAKQVIDIARWPILAFVVVIAIGVLYRWGPSRQPPRWSWVSPGAVLATILLLVASGIFSLYVSTFGNYAATYGSLASVAVLMLWLFIGAYSVLLGAEVNAEAERQ